MRNLIIVAAAFLLSSCAAYVPYQKLSFATFLDYRPYIADGFYVSPDAEYPEGCEILGELRLEHYPEQVQIKDEYYARYEAFTYKRGKWYGFPRVAYAELLQSAVQRAKTTGADGLVKFRIEHRDIGSRPYYIITGVCIKR